MTLIYNRGVLLAAIESTFDSPEPMDGEDAFEVIDPIFEPRITAQERAITPESLSAFGSVVTRMVGRMTFRLEVKSNGNTDASVPPRIGRLLRACGMSEEAITSATPAGCLYRAVADPNNAGDMDFVCETYNNLGIMTKVKVEVLAYEERLHLTHPAEAEGFMGIPEIGDDIFDTLGYKDGGEVTYGGLPRQARWIADESGETIELFQAGFAVNVGGWFLNIGYILSGWPSAALDEHFTPDETHIRLDGFTRPENQFRYSDTLRLQPDFSGIFLPDGDNAILYVPFGDTWPDYASTGETTEAFRFVAHSPEDDVCFTTYFTSNPAQEGDVFWLHTRPIGHVYSPTTDNPESVTLDLFHADENGEAIRHRMTGCRGTVRAVGAVGEVPVFEFEFIGSYVDAQDDPLPAPVYEGQQPVGVEYGALALATEYGPKVPDLCASQWSFDVRNQVVARDDINAFNATRGAALTGRRPRVTFNCEAKLIAETPIWSHMELNRQVEFWVRHGIEDGNIVLFHAPNARITNLRYNNRNGIRDVEVELLLGRLDNNDEYQIIFT